MHEKLKIEYTDAGGNRTEFVRTIQTGTDVNATVVLLRQVMVAMGFSPETAMRLNLAPQDSKLDPFRAIGPITPDGFKPWVAPQDSKATDEIIPPRGTAGRANSSRVEPL